jgi:hypothetical protein
MGLKLPVAKAAAGGSDLPIVQAEKHHGDPVFAKIERHNSSILYFDGHWIAR